MRALLRWAPCVLGGILAGVAALLVFGYALPWVGRSGAAQWFFMADWPVLPPVGWVIAAIVGFAAAGVCRAVRR